MQDTAPESVPAPEAAHVHFILHIEQCTVQTTHLFCMLNTYQELAEFEIKFVAAKGRVKKNPANHPHFVDKRFPPPLIHIGRS